MISKIILIYKETVTKKEKIKRMVYLHLSGQKLNILAHSTYTQNILLTEIFALFYILTELFSLKFKPLY